MNEWNANVYTRNDTMNAMLETMTIKQAATVMSGVSSVANTALSSAKNERWW